MNAVPTQKLRHPNNILTRIKLKGEFSLRVVT